MASLNVPQSPAFRAAMQAFPGRRVIIGMMFFAAALTIAYWLIWFSNRDILASANTLPYYTFENAFPAADGWLALSLLLGATGLLRLKRWGVYWVIVAGGSGIYLGCMDVLFDLENGIYSFKGDPGAAIVEISINILTFGLGIIGLIWGWRVFAALTRNSKLP